MGKNNKDVKREYDRRYYQNHKQERLEYDRQYRREHKRERREYEEQYYEGLRIEIFSHYGKGSINCSGCGIEDIDVLTIDHIDGNGNEHRKTVSHGRGGLIFYKWLKRNDFPEGYQVLCYNCNIKKHRMATRAVLKGVMYG